jgi:hypothetical protein
MTEIFDSFTRLSEVIHSRDEIKSLKEQNHSLNNECGCCKLWITSQCPKESKKKVSCTDLVCEKFDKNDWVKNLLIKNENKIKELESKIKP